MGKWLEELRAHRKNTPLEALTEQTKAPSVSFVGKPGEEFQSQNISERSGNDYSDDHLKLPIQTVDDMDRLKKAVQEALEWPDLEKALERAQIGYKRDELKAEEVEALALLAAQRAHIVPEKAEFERGRPPPGHHLKNPCLKIFLDF